MVGRCRPYVAAPFRRGGHGSSEVVSRPRGVGTAPWRGDPRARLGGRSARALGGPPVRQGPAAGPAGHGDERRASERARRLPARSQGHPAGRHPAQGEAIGFPERRGEAEGAARQGQRPADRVRRPREGRAATFKELGRTQTALNAVIAEVDARSLAELSRDPAVLKISPVVDYQLDLSETVPYIGGTAVQATGRDGRRHHRRRARLGHRLHARRTSAARAPASRTRTRTAPSSRTRRTRRSTTPTRARSCTRRPRSSAAGTSWASCGPAARAARRWPRIPTRSRAARARSRRPATAPTGRTSRTSSPARLGVAPEAKLLAVKVCSSITHLLLRCRADRGHGLRPRPQWRRLHRRRRRHHQHVARIPYGPASDDDLSAAVQTATDAGTLVVASAGNSGDKPYIVGSPSSAPAALSVAETAVPSSTGFAMLLSTGGRVHPARGRLPVLVQAAHGGRCPDQRRGAVRRRRRRQPGRLRRLRGRLARRQGRPRRPRHLHLHASRSRTSRAAMARSA